jgi:peptidoglycan/xylan/chitin deacetylase (PgdA/CDA1 family)
LERPGEEDEVLKRSLKSFATGLFANRMGAALLRPLWRGRSAVFVLHRLSERAGADDALTIEAITSNLRALRKAGARFVSLHSLFELAARGEEPEPGCVAFTIDDGYADQGVMAKKAFLDNGCPVTVFLISGLLDGLLWPWDARIEYSIQRSSRDSLRLEALGGETLPLATGELRARAIGRVQNHCKALPWTEAAPVFESLFAATGCVPPETPPPEYRPLSWAEARRLEAAGVQFAPHSISHRITSRLTPEQVREEICGSWQRLQQELASPVPIYAWPTGRGEDFSPRDIEIAATTPLLGAVSVTNDYARFSKGEATARNDFFAISRFPMSVSTEDIVQYGTALERFKQLVRLTP